MLVFDPAYHALDVNSDAVDVFWKLPDKNVAYIRVGGSEYKLGKYELVFRRASDKPVENIKVACSCHRKDSCPVADIAVTVVVADVVTDVVVDVFGTSLAEFLLCRIWV